MGGAMRAGLVVLLAVLGCATPGRQTREPMAPPMLRVGVSPDAPPVAFMQDGRIVGIEPDLAQALSDQSRRPLALIPMEFNALIPALLEGRMDAFVPGMSGTPARRVRVASPDRYLRGGLLPACRRAD